MKSQSKMINLKVGDVIKSRLCDETYIDDCKSIK